jgi:hypothetical protein
MPARRVWAVRNRGLALEYGTGWDDLPLPLELPIGRKELPTGFGSPKGELAKQMTGFRRNSLLGRNRERNLTPWLWLILLAPRVGPFGY